MVRLLVAVLGFSTITAAAKGADVADPWLGTWVNVDSKEGGITKLVVAAGKNGGTIQAWARCRPQDCDWGATPLASFGYATPYRFATWDPKFKDVYMTLRPEKDEIAAEIFTIYKDGSRRENHRMEYRFKRPEE